MNRTIALFVGLAVLLAHTLTIHDTIYDDFAPPYELAHVAYRIARNLVYGDGLSWSPGHAGFDAYPSPLWVAISALGQRAYLGVNVFSQTIGILCALSTAITLSWFRRERAAGLIAPLLLVVNGAQAAAAASGTENALFSLSAIFSFLSLEKGWRKRFALGLLVLCATRPEGVVFALGFGILALFQRREASLVKRLMPFVPALAWLTLIACLRHASNGHWLSPTGFDLLAFSSERTWRGVEFVEAFARSQVTPILVLVPLALLVTGKLPAIGGRCLFLASLWIAVVIARGGLSLPFAQVMLPALPFLFLAVQAAMFTSLDRIGIIRNVALASLGAAILMSGLASRTPSDLGPLPLSQIYHDWFGPGFPAKYRSRGHMGRTGLADEIRDTRRLRSIALFLRDHLEPTDSVLTPWPGSAGYLSRLDIIDLLGRTHLWPGQERLSPWLGTPTVDLSVALESSPDYIIFSLAPLQHAPRPHALAQSWIKSFDNQANQAGRLERITGLFSKYEPVAVPIRGLQGTGARTSEFYFLLRKLELGRGPVIDISIQDGRFVVRARHASHEQIVDLRLTVIDDTGTSWSVDPRGMIRADAQPVARSGIELYSSDRPFRLMEGVLPVLPAEAKGARAVEIHAVLSNPDTGSARASGAASNRAIASIP